MICLWDYGYERVEEMLVFCLLLVLCDFIVVVVWEMGRGGLMW